MTPIRLKFKNQRCQEDAALAVVSVFQGQPKNDASSAPGSRPEFRNGKLYYYNANRTVAVIADVGRGYLRIKDMTRAGRRSYLDINGNDATWNVRLPVRHGWYPVHGAFPLSNPMS